MAKNTTQIKDLQFDRNAEINNCLNSSRQYILNHSNNPFLIYMLKKMPNPFNPISSSMFSTYDKTSSVTRAETYLKENGTTIGNLKAFAEYNRYDKSCRDQESTLDLFYRGLGKGVLIDPLAQDLYTKMCIGGDSFIPRCMQLGMIYEASNEDIARMLRIDCQVSQYVSKNKYDTPELVRDKWTKESQLVDALQYMNKLGFISTLIGDVARSHMYGNTLSDNLKQELMNVYLTLSKPEFVIDDEIMQTLGSRKTYDDLLRDKKGEERDNVIFSIYHQVLSHVKDKKGNPVPANRIIDSYSSSIPFYEFGDESEPQMDNK